MAGQLSYESLQREHVDLGDVTAGRDEEAESRVIAGLKRFFSGMTGFSVESRKGAPLANFWVFDIVSGSMGDHEKKHIADNLEGSFVQSGATGTSVFVSRSIAKQFSVATAVAKPEPAPAPAVATTAGRTSPVQKILNISVGVIVLVAWVYVFS